MRVADIDQNKKKVQSTYLIAVYDGVFLYPEWNWNTHASLLPCGSNRKTIFSTLVWIESAMCLHHTASYSRWNHHVTRSMPTSAELQYSITWDHQRQHLACIHATNQRIYPLFVLSCCLINAGFLTACAREIIGYKYYCHRLFKYLLFPGIFTRWTSYHCCHFG